MMGVDTGSGFYIVDGSQSVPITIGANLVGGSPTLRFGGLTNNGNNNIRADIPEFILFDSALTSDEKTGLQYLIGLKWGFPTVAATQAQTDAANALFVGTPRNEYLTQITELGDFNLDTVVDLVDFGILRDNMAAHLDRPVVYSDGDIDFDGIIDLNDFNQLKSLFPGVVAAATSVPEPSSLVSVLCALAGITAVVQRRFLRAFRTED
jgi:hypothetical protein